MLRHVAFVGTVVLTTGLLITAVLYAGQQSRTGAITTDPRLAAARPAAASSLPPLPAPGYPPARPLQTVHEAYEFAARHPEVLRYVPCFCGCERDGHGGNHDCFVHTRDSQGRVTWDPHGYGCQVCVDVAHDAMLMYNSGASVGAIRASIEKKYSARFHTHTPTPDPPKPAARPAR